MKTNHISELTFLFLLFCAVTPSMPQVPQATPNSAQDAEGYYRQALSAYLDGNYDTAILLTAHSLEKDPANAKSKSLLSILTNEKEREGKTVIWLEGKPMIVTPTPMATLSDGDQLEMQEIQTKAKVLQEQLDGFMRSQKTQNVANGGQLEVIKSLVQSDSEARYGELRKQQAQIYEKLKEIDSRRGSNLNFLYLLCFSSVGVSLWALLRKFK